MPAVTLYTRRACENCDRARDWLERHRIAFRECNIDQPIGCHHASPADLKPRELPEVWVGDYRLYDTASRVLDQAFGFDADASRPGKPAPSLPRLIVTTGLVVAVFGSAIRVLRRAKRG